MILLLGMKLIALLRLTMMPMIMIMMIMMMMMIMRMIQIHLSFCTYWKAKTSAMAKASVPLHALPVPLLSFHWLVQRIESN